MKSWNLKRFTDEYGAVYAGNVWGVSHQAVYAAILKRRDIQIILLDGVYEVRESKVLKKINKWEVELCKHL